MESMIACCGLNCEACGAYQAHRDDDDRKREATAAMWSKLFKVKIPPESINCEGCHSTTGIVFRHCSTCEIRACAREKEIKNCGWCSVYPCERLDFIFGHEPAAKKRLDDIHSRR